MENMLTQVKYQKNNGSINSYDCVTHEGYKYCVAPNKEMSFYFFNTLNELRFLN